MSGEGEGDGQGEGEGELGSRTSASFVKIGAMRWHGPHHVAVKSTTT